MDLAHESYLAKQLTGEGNVSILVLVDLAHEYIYTLGILSIVSGVSILVLVDLAHESKNSLFMSSPLSVSILVLVDLAHESSEIDFYLFTHRPFQSLF